jgi:hypothetical protein
VVPRSYFIAFRDERTLHTELQRGFLDAVVLLCRLHLARLTVASADYFDHVIKVARFLSVICLRLALVPCSAVRCTIQLALAIPTALNGPTTLASAAFGVDASSTRRPQPSLCMGHPPPRLGPRTPDVSVTLCFYYCSANAVKHTTRTLYGPPSTGAAIAMDGGVADTACYYTGR